MATIDSEVLYTAIPYLLGNLLVICTGSGLVTVSLRYAFAKDRTYLKTTVRVGAALLSVHVLLAFADTIYVFGQGFGNIDRVFALSPVFVTNVIVGATIAAMIQGFYAWRSYILLGRQLWLAICLGVLIAFTFAATVVAHALALNSNNPALFQTNGASLESFIFLRLPYIAAISIDAILCGLTLLALYRARKFGSPQGVGMLMKRLVLLTITSNGLTTILFLILLISSFTAPSVFWSLTLTSAEMYMLTLMVWLFSRSSEGGGGVHTSGGQQQSSPQRTKDRSTRRTMDAQDHSFANAITVEHATSVYTSKEEERDYELGDLRPVQ